MNANAPTSKTTDSTAISGKAEHLKRYFQHRKPNCTMMLDYKFDESKWRFYFEERGRHRNILDVTANVLADLELHEIIRRLEKARWESVLDSHSKEITVFGSEGFSFRPLPR